MFAIPNFDLFSPFLSVTAETSDMFKSERWNIQTQTASVLHPQTLSTIPPSTGQNKRYGNILVYETSVISSWSAILTINIDVLQRRMLPQHLFCPVDGRIVLRVQGLERTSCLCLNKSTLSCSSVSLGIHVFSTLCGIFVLTGLRTSALCKIVMPEINVKGL